MKTVIVIPARYASSRFPGKPLTEIKGLTMINRVWKLAKAVPGVSDVIIATDDVRIKNHAESFSAKVIMTDESLRNGSERAYQAIKKLDYLPDLIINFQGDSVLTPPWLLEDLVKLAKATSNFEMGTVVVKLDQLEAKKEIELKKQGDLGCVLCVFDQQQRALYFSRSLIPCKRDAELTDWNIYRHIGIYAYTPAILEKYISLEPSPLEQAEELEQLRALENGINIQVAISDYRGRTPGSIDTPADKQKVEKIIESEGELL